jgi:branched-chain amino acid transport system permease protein
LPSTYKLQPADAAVYPEFRDRPFGHHSTQLQRVLNRLRTGPMAGKYVLVCTKPHREWMLAQLPDNAGAALRLHHNRIFHSLEEAEREVFKLRWEQHTGQALEG